MNKISQVLVICVFLIPLFVFAHPGNTASDGMHYCRTNCDYWGVPWNERHRHGGTYTSSYYSTPTCPANSYSLGSSCKCNFGYIASGGSCISGNSYCMDLIGSMSAYDSLTGSCKCMSGYEIGASGLCTYKSSFSDYSYLFDTYSTSMNCPAHSSESVTGSCSCDEGYKANSAKTKCVKIKRGENDKLCRAAFGPKSQWSKEYENGDPTCICKKGYEWSEDGSSCVKSD